jgi:hypothetical protein
MVAELATTLTSTEDERLEQAEGVVRAYCGWHIAPSRTVTETCPTAGGLLFLPSLHVTAVGSVTLSDETVLTTDQYEWTTEGVVRLIPGWGRDWWTPYAPAKATVEYTHGYPTPPPEVVGVVRAVAQRATDNPRSVVQQNTGPFGVTYSQAGGQALTLAILDTERAVLDHYRLNARP